jgi:hypothetical protein
MTLNEDTNKKFPPSLIIYEPNYVSKHDLSIMYSLYAFREKNA